jgi:hypothetical protein
VHSQIQYTTSAIEDTIRLTSWPKARSVPTAGWAVTEIYYLLSVFG